MEKQEKSTLIIVDDEQTILTELEILLCRRYTVHTFVNPEEVEPFVRQNHVDLIICDEMMPEMRGSELLARLHAIQPDICKIVLSGQAEKHDIVKAINKGHIYSFLFKPVNREQLFNIIENGLESRRMKLLLKEQNIMLKDLNENLEEKVKERTEQLVKAHRRLQQLDDNKMSFLLYLANEINAPLDRLKKLAEALITYFGIAGSDLTIKKEALPLQEEIETILGENSKLIQARELSIDNRVQEPLQIMADREYLHFLLATLINNALLFTPNGGRISLEATTEGKKNKIVIHDTGRGFPPDDQLQLFTPFILPQEKRNPDGFGLNLVQAKIITEAHGGRLLAESPGQGQGATFTLIL